MFNFILSNVNYKFSLVCDVHSFYNFFKDIEILRLNLKKVKSSDLKKVKSSDRQQSGTGSIGVSK
jgi:hypothetical protein